MVLPGDDLKVNLRDVGMREGNIVVQVETANDRGEKVLQGTAEIAQPTTVYVFTGQGSQEQGMGMDLYNSSLAARAVWDGADTHLLAVYGFSIIEIVKDNPKQKTIHLVVLRDKLSGNAIWICHTTQWTGMVISKLCLSLQISMLVRPSTPSAIPTVSFLPLSSLLRLRLS
jgi:hypothetical protein